jgi:hypothetical protein
VLTSGCCTTRCAATRRFSLLGRTGFLGRGSSSIRRGKVGLRAGPTCQITKPGHPMPGRTCSGATAAAGMRGHPPAHRHKIL